MDKALEEVEKLVAIASDEERQQTMIKLRKLAYSLETPTDTSLRYAHLTLQASVAKIAVDLGLFKCLTASLGPLSVVEFSHRTGAEQLLLERILRYLAANDAVDEIDGHKYCANNITRNLAEDLTDASIRHYSLTVAPAFQALPEFLKRSGHRSPSKEAHTAFHDAWNTSENVYSWVMSHPAHLEPFNEYMALRGKDQPKNSWLLTYPARDRLEDLPADRPVFVDVGGGIGHQAAEFLQKFPDMSGRVFLQDLPNSIAKALQTPGVENMAHDFFLPQPIKAARFYYMRSVLHNHPPSQARKLLKNTRAAMAPDSILIIDEIVLPQSGVSANLAAIDMHALTIFASMERTEAQWQETVVDVGLQLLKVYPYGGDNHECVMEVRLPV